MILDYVIIENWYEDPNTIRSTALKRFKQQSSFGESKISDNGYAAYPGYRCKSTIQNLLENKVKIEQQCELCIDPTRWIYVNTCDFQNSLESLEFDFGSMAMRVKDSDITLNMSESSSNGCFQYCPESSQMWVHHDEGNFYAAVIYLTPAPPEGSGTGFFRNKLTGKSTPNDSDSLMTKEESHNFNNWELTDYVENVYNRCVIFNAKKFHSATKYFGTIPEDSRLTQVFFFDTI